MIKYNNEEEIFKIKDCDNGYISQSGNIYIEKNGIIYQKKTYNTAGYVYVKLLYNGKLRSKRVHRLLAEMFIDNPHNYPIVGHKNNNKSDNKISNLYWTTHSENTQKAFDDNLIQNKTGYEDSQSIPIYVCDSEWNILYDFGSISECAKALGILKTTISKQINMNPENRKFSRSNIYFIKQSDYEKHSDIKRPAAKEVIAININTGEQIKFSSFHECEKCLNISRQTIINRIKNPDSKNRCGYEFVVSNDYRKYN